MSGLRRVLLAVCLATLASPPGAGAAAWLPAQELRPIATDSGEDLAMNGSGEAIVVATDQITIGQRAFRIWRRPPGGDFVEQVVPEGGDSDIPNFADPDLAMNEAGGAVMAWRQDDLISEGLFYSLREPGGAFGPPQEVTALSSVGLGSLDVGLDGAGNVTFVWTTITGPTFNQISHVHAVQRKPDGSFVSAETLESIGPGGTTFGGASVSVNESGRAVATWDSSDLGPGASRFAFRDAPVGVFAPLINAGNPGVKAAMGPNGAAAVLYVDLPTLHARYRTPQGVLSPEATLATTNSTPDVGLAADGTATALWERPEGEEHLRACRFTTGECLEPIQTLVSRNGDVAGGDLAVGSAGHAVAAWREGTNPQTTAWGAARAGTSPFGPPTMIGPLISSVAVVGVDDVGHGIAAFRSGGSMKYSAYDPVPPRIDAVTSPARGLRREPLSFSATVFDFWGPVTLDWQFGDGGSAQGGAVTHAFRLSGVLPVTVTATDAAGNASSAQRVVRIAHPPRFTRGPTIVPAVFAVARGRTRVRGRSTARRGARFRYSLDSAARVTIRIQRRLPGRRARYRRAGTLVRASRRGRNVVRFTGRIGRRALRAGRHRAVFTARDAAGNPSRPRAVRFRVVRR